MTVSDSWKWSSFSCSLYKHHSVLTHYYIHLTPCDAVNSQCCQTYCTSQQCTQHYITYQLYDMSLKAQLTVSVCVWLMKWQTHRHTSLLTSHLYHCHQLLTDRAAHFTLLLISAFTATVHCLSVCLSVSKPLFSRTSRQVYQSPSSSWV